jgi:hypothetical protein
MADSGFIRQTCYLPMAGLVVGLGAQGHVSLTRTRNRVSQRESSKREKGISLANRAAFLRHCRFYCLVTLTCLATVISRTSQKSFVHQDEYNLIGRNIIENNVLAHPYHGTRGIEGNVS